MSKIADWIIHKLGGLTKTEIPEGLWMEMCGGNHQADAKVEKIIAFADMPDGGIATKERAAAKERVRKKLARAIEVGGIIQYEFCDGYCKGTIRVVK